MRSVRIFLLAAATVLVVGLIGLAVVLNPTVQTWAVRRALSSRPEDHISIARVNAGFRRVELTDLRYERDGLRFVAPTVTADLDVWAAAVRHRFFISHLVAKDWTCDVRAAVAPVTEAATSPAGAPSTSVAKTVAPAARFRGLFPAVELPFELRIDQAELAGEIAVQAAGAKFRVSGSGGNLGVTQAGRFELNATALLQDETVQSVTVHCNLTTTMDSPRTFADFSLQGEATAVGKKLAGPVTLRFELGAHRSGQAESYAVALNAQDRPLVNLQVTNPTRGTAISGRWSVDIRDSDVTPFALGHALPTFSAVGSGQMETDGSFDDVHLVGSIDARLDHLTTINNALSAVGPVRLFGDLDLAHRRGIMTVRKVNVVLSGARGTAAEPDIASVSSLQSFEFDLQTGDLRAQDASQGLLGIVLRGLPLGWVRPLVPQLDFSGGDLRGELVATPRAGGINFQSTVPISITDLTLGRKEEHWLRNVDVALSILGDYTPQGWQTEISNLSARSAGASLFVLEAKAGRLAGNGQPIKAAGTITTDLAALVAQPFARGALVLKRGGATVEFVASVDGQTSLQAHVVTKDLAAEKPPKTATAQPELEVMPVIAATIRADVSPDGRMTLQAPMTLERAGRISDLNITGAFSPGTAGGTFDAQVTSTSFVLDDAKSFAALIPGRRAKTPADEKPEMTPLAPPPWVGLRGDVTLQLKKVLYSGTFQMSDVVGKVRFDGGTIKFEQVRADVGEGGDASVSGALQFDGKAENPFSLGAEVALTDFDPGPLFLAVSPKRAPTIEGKFTVKTKVNASAPTFQGLAAATVGEFELTSRAGTFRGLQVNVGNLVENSSKLYSWLATAGNAITSITPFVGKKDDDDEITSRSKAAQELAKIISTIVYDQLALVVVRDKSLNADVKEFSLISPELRIAGSGRSHSVRGKSPIHDYVELELKIRARGRPAELMKYLGVLEPKTDDLGYANCAIPVKVEGSLTRLDTTQLSNRLVALAVAKTGLTEKAVDWINRLRGK